MGKKAYIGAQGTAQQARKIYVGTGKARMAKKAYLGDENGIARLVFTGGAAWLKYSCDSSTTYEWTDARVGETGTYTLWDRGALFTAYTFDEVEGFYGDGWDNYVTFEDASQAAGAYSFSSESVWQLGAIIEVHDQYGDTKGYTYETTCVASAEAYTSYSKGSTSYGTIYADEDQQPEAGEVLEHGSDHYVIRTASGAYWYQLVKED